MSKIIKKRVTCESCDSAYEISYPPGAVMHRPDRRNYCYFCGEVFDEEDEYIDIDEDVEDEIEEE